MSRCFPFPPSGFLVKNSSSIGAGVAVALIEPTMKPFRLPSVSKTVAVANPKLESDKAPVKIDKAQIKIDRKEQKRREKEEKKKEKKREKERLKSLQNLDGAKKRKRSSERSDSAVDKSCVDCKEVHKKSKRKQEAEQLERSSLTEEHEQPILSESLSYSSDGTQSNTKKSRIEQPASNGLCTTRGKVIRFKLKRREPENSSNNNAPSTSGRTSSHETEMPEPLPTQAKSRGAFTVSDVTRKDVIPRLAEQQIIHPTNTDQYRDTTYQAGSSSVERSQKPKSAYEALFSDWVPLPIHFEKVDCNDDQQWLIRTTKKQVTHDVGRLSAYGGLAGRHSSLFCPRAHFVPEVDLYALPYTVPF